MEESRNQKNIEPAIHVFVQQLQNKQNKMNYHSSPTLGSSTPQVIVVPYQDKDGHQKGLIKEVYRYPPESIRTVVEKHLQSDEVNDNGHACKRVEKKKKKSKPAKQSSPAPSVSSVVSNPSVTCHSDSVSHHGSDSTSNSEASSVGYHRQLKLFERLSDTSSNLSTYSDLSGYEDEYNAVKNLLTHGTNAPMSRRFSRANPSSEERSFLKAKLKEQEDTIKLLQCCKDDLEIQVHRLETQFQNLSREKEVCEDQLGLMLGNISDKNQQEIFELQKEKVNLEGKYEALKVEFEHSLFNSDQLQIKLSQNELETEKYEKDKAKLQSTTAELQEVILKLEENNLNLENEMKNLSENLVKEKSNYLSIQTQLSDTDNLVKHLEYKVKSFDTESKNHEELMISMNKQHSELSEIVECERNEKVQLKHSLGECAKEVSHLKESNDWYQSQLSKTQDLLSSVQHELTETKNTLATLSADKERYKCEAERLNAEVEDSRVRAVSEKTSLLIQLEELEADMREREATIHRLEKGEEGVHVKVSENRLMVLEEEHKKLQELKIEYRDSLNQINSLKEEIQHKNVIIKKHEENIHKLRRDCFVVREEIESKECCIKSLSERLETTKCKLDKAFEEVKATEAIVSRLKEEKGKLTASLFLAEDNKRHVDETVARLKEDMNKLSSNFFRMKHDLLAKDKHIESLCSRNSELMETEKKLLSINQALEEQLKDKQMIIESGSNSLIKLKSVEEENTRVKKDFEKLKATSQVLEVERHSLSNALNLRDEQIVKMQTLVETYKEAIHAKEKEISNEKKQSSNMQESLDRLQKKFDNLNEEYSIIRQERDEFHELEVSHKSSIAALKECVQLEKQSKEKYISKNKGIVEELNKGKDLIAEKNEIISSLNSFKENFEKEKEFSMAHEKKCEELNAALLVQRDTNVDLETKIKSLNLRLDEVHTILRTSENKYLELVALKNSDIESLHAALATSKTENEKLSALLAEKENDRQARDSVSNKKFVNSFRNKKTQNTKILPKSLIKNSKEEKCEIENLKQKIREITGRLAEKNEEISGLKASLSENQSLSSSNVSLTCEIERLKSELTHFTEKNEGLSNGIVSLQEKLRDCSSLVTEKEQECNEWKSKYETLVDGIPQRDTDAQQPALFSQCQARQNFDDVFEKGIQSEKEEMSQVEKPLCQNFNLEERVQFSQTMTYLQKQISLTAETLQSKDRQIRELNERINDLSTTSQVGNNNRTSFDESSVSVDVPCANVESTSHFDANIARVSGVTEPSSVALEVSKCKSQEENDSEQKSVREAEWKEKQRRYESNVRLLTRKLKEHMKGRRAAEKELLLNTQLHERKFQTEEERYASLNKRFSEVEAKCDALKSELSSCERAYEEKKSIIQNVKDDLERERQTVLQLQSENGQVKELKQRLDNLKLKFNSQKTELNIVKQQKNEISESHEAVLKQKGILEVEHRSLLNCSEKMKQQLQEEHQKISVKDELLTTKENEIIEKNEIILNLNEKLTNFELKIENLLELLRFEKNEKSELAEKVNGLSKQIQELEKDVIVKVNENEDVTAKRVIIEGELKMKDEIIESLRKDEETLKKQVTVSEEKIESLTASHLKKIDVMRENEAALNEQLAVIHREKMAYQAQCTRLKVALNSALEKLQDNSELQSLPSPSPLNTETLTRLLEHCSKPPPGTGKFRVSLADRLNGLREEVSTLQSQIKARDEPAMQI